MGTIIGEFTQGAKFDEEIFVYDIFLFLNRITIRTSLTFYTLQIIADFSRVFSNAVSDYQPKFLSYIQYVLQTRVLQTNSELRRCETNNTVT